VALIALVVVGIVFGIGVWQTVDLYGPALGRRSRRR
jgi:hypothetical protein